MLRSISLAVALTLGTAAIANGVFMLVAPENWYFAVPGVTTTGPFNQHFVRDIGLIFLFIGASFLIGAAKPDLRIVFWAAPTSGSQGTHFSTSGKLPSASALPPSFLAISQR